MAKNQVQFQRGYSLFEFMEDYGTETKCETALFRWRFPNGRPLHKAKKNWLPANLCFLNTKKGTRILVASATPRYYAANFIAS